MDAPVDQRASARQGFRGKGAAQPGNGAVGAEGDIHMIDLAQPAAVDILLYLVHAVVEPVHHPNIEHLPGFVLHLLHLKGFSIVAGARLLAKHMLARAQGVCGNYAVHVIGRAYRNGLDLGVREHLMIIGHRFAASIFLHSLFSPLGQNIAKIPDLRRRIFEIGRNMGRVGDVAASNDSDFDFHTDFLLFSSDSAEVCCL